MSMPRLVRATPATRVVPKRYTAITECLVALAKKSAGVESGRAIREFADMEAYTGVIAIRTFFRRADT